MSKLLCVECGTLPPPGVPVNRRTAAEEFATEHTESAEIFGFAGRAYLPDIKVALVLRR